MNKAFIALLWIASALLTYWLGLEQGSDSAYTKTSNQSLPGDSSLVVQNNAEKPQQTPKISPNPSAREPSAPVEVVEVDLDRAEERIYESDSPDLQERIKSSNPVVRLRAFTELLQDGSTESIEQAREIYEKLPEGPQRFSELRMLAFSWGQSDPQAALEWSNNLEGFDKRIGTGSVLDSWARYDSDGAIAWAKENFEGEDNPYFIGIISGMSQNDLIGASELMTTLPYGRTRGRAASILVEKTWQMGEDVAIHFADNLLKAQFRILLLAIAKKIAKDDLAIVQWVEKMDESEVKVRVSEDVAERWAKDVLHAANGYPNACGEARSESMKR